MEVPAAPVVITDYFVFAHIESKQLAVRKAVGGEWVAGQDAFTAADLYELLGRSREGGMM